MSLSLSIYLYMLIDRAGAERPAGGRRRNLRADRRIQAPPDTVSFHNFKSQNFKLSVSNHESKYVAYLSVLSQISNCQSLGRKQNMKF